MYAILNLSFLSNICLIAWYFAALCGFELIVSIYFCLNLSYRLIYAVRLIVYLSEFSVDLYRFGHISICILI